MLIIVRIAGDKEESKKTQELIDYLRKKDFPFSIKTQLDHEDQRQQGTTEPHY